MAEEWKPIEQLEGYSVSSYGNIRNDKTGNIRKFVPSKHNRYARLSIGNTAHRKQYAVHRLVAEAFLEKPEGAYEVNHINGNKYDNRVENLEWCTHSENMKHACRTGLCPYPKAPTSPVVQLSPNMQILGIYDSCVEASEATGVPVNLRDHLPEEQGLRHPNTVLAFHFLNAQRPSSRRTEGLRPCCPLRPGFHARPQRPSSIRTRHP